MAANFSLPFRLFPESVAMTWSNNLKWWATFSAQIRCDVVARIRRFPRAFFSLKYSMRVRFVRQILYVDVHKFGDVFLCDRTTLNNPDRQLDQPERISFDQLKNRLKEYIRSQQRAIKIDDDMINAFCPFFVSVRLNLAFCILLNSNRQIKLKVQIKKYLAKRN